MAKAAWTVPLGVLSAIVVIGFVYTWWWFPRAWQKGVNHDHTQIAAAQGADREAQRAANRAIIERYTRASARARGEVVEGDDDVETERGVERDVEMGIPPPAYGGKGRPSESTVRV